MKSPAMKPNLATSQQLPRRETTLVTEALLITSKIGFPIVPHGLLRDTVDGADNILTSRRPRVGFWVIIFDEPT